MEDIDPLLYAARAYSGVLLDPTPDNNLLIDGVITVLNYTPEEPEFIQYFMTIGDFMLRLYTDRMEYLEDRDNFILQIPLNAIEQVIKSFDDKTLNLDYDDSNTTEFLGNRFAVKLRNDFLYLYLNGGYSNSMDTDVL